MRTLSLVLVFFCACASAPARPDLSQRRAALQSAEAVEIARLEDARNLGEGRLEQLTRAPAPALRARAMLALARLQAPETTGVIGAALDDADPEVRAAAAFALGEQGLAWEPVPEAERALAERGLIARLAVEKDAEARGEILESLGKVGSEPALAALTGALKGAERARAAVALGVLAKSSGGKLKQSAAIPGLLRMLASSADAERFAAAYALMRTEEPAGRAGLAGCLGDSRPEVRAACARGLAAMRSADDLARVATLLSDPDERVAAEAARSLAKLVVTCANADECPALRELQKSSSPWRPAVASAIAAEPITLPQAAPLFRAQHQLRTQCETALGHDRALGRIDLLKTCDGVKQARALSEAKSPVEARAPGLLELAKSPLAAVRAASVPGLAVLATAETRQALVALLADPDWNVASESAGAVESSKLVEAGPALVALLERAKGEEASDAAQAALSAAATLKFEQALAPAKKLLAEGPRPVRQAAARAIAALTGKMPDLVLPPWEPGPYVNEPVPDRAVVRLVTERGTVRLVLYRDEAPLTVKNFLHLVRQGFYKGLTFHRVVPNFVAQGGDPKSDGSGGPGYSIRCEINLRHYREGSLGMALSGKDTGGSQFFVTLSPQPHLDGRYTNFGEVIEGMEAVRALGEGDHILDAQVE